MDTTQNGGGEGHGGGGEEAFSYSYRSHILKTEGIYLHIKQFHPLTFLICNNNTN